MQFTNTGFSKTSRSYISGKEKAAIFVGELNQSAFAAIEQCLPHNYKVLLTKALKKLGKRVDFAREIDVLEEANYWGVQRGLAHGIHSDEEIEHAVLIHQKMNGLRGASSPNIHLDPAVIAGVLGQWLKEQ